MLCLGSQDALLSHNKRLALNMHSCHREGRGLALTMHELHGNDYGLALDLEVQQTPHQPASCRITLTTFTTFSFGVNDVFLYCWVHG